MMAREFLSNFTNHVLSVGQSLLFTLPEKPLMTLKIKSIEGKYLCFQVIADQTKIKKELLEYLSMIHTENINLNKFIEV